MWTLIKDITFDCIYFFQTVVGDWGLAIIIITVIIRLCLTPLTVRQYRSTYQMQKLQPLIKELQEKYKDEPQRLNEEMSKVYADNKYSPLAGCLPVLIQMPIFIALYQVLREQIPAGSHFYGMISDLVASPSTMWSQGFLACLPYIILVALFAVSIIVPMMMQPGSNNMTKMMTVMMTLMMVWFGWVAPAGVILFWVASAYIGLGQQFFIRRKMKNKDELEAEAKIDITPVKVNVVRREHKSRPKKSR